MTTSVATTAPTRLLDIGGTRFAYRRFGNPAGTPLVLTQHFMANLDNFDPAELMLLPDSGHGAHFQYVERFVRRVIDFLDVQPHDTATPA
jgi:pimeloyl-ACP methyl ester carboxylesterase